MPGMTESARRGRSTRMTRMAPTLATPGSRLISPICTHGAILRNTNTTWTSLGVSSGWQLQRRGRCGGGVRQLRPISAEWAGAEGQWDGAGRGKRKP